MFEIHIRYVLEDIELLGLSYTNKKKVAQNHATLGPQLE